LSWTEIGFFCRARGGHFRWTRTALALGSDFDGIKCELEWKDYSGYHLIIEALSKIYSEDEVEMISFGNALRVFKDVIGH